MAANEYTPKFKPGADVTYRATEDVKAGRLVEVSGDTAVKHAAAGSAKVVGVAAFDAKAGDLVTVRSAHIGRLVAVGAVAAGDRVAAAADGRVATTANATTIGTAIAAAANGELALVKLDK